MQTIKNPSLLTPRVTLPSFRAQLTSPPDLNDSGAAETKSRSADLDPAQTLPIYPPTATAELYGDIIPVRVGLLLLPRAADVSLRFRQLSGGAARRAERSCASLPPPVSASGTSRLTGADGADGAAGGG